MSVCRIEKTPYTSEMAESGERDASMSAVNEKATIGKEIFHEKKIPALVSGLEGLSGLGDPERLKIIFLKSGSGIVRKAGESASILSPSIVLLDNRDSHAVELSQGGATGAVLFFHPRFVNDALSFDALEGRKPLPERDRGDKFLLSPFLGKKNAADMVLCVQPDVYGYFEILLRNMKQTLETQADEFWPCRARSFLLEILIQLQHCCSSKGSIKALHPGPDFPWNMTADENKKTEPILTFLTRNYSKRITIKALAERFSTNRTTIQKLFKTATGWSIAQYLIRMRVQIAALMLRDTTLTVSEIIARTGFENLSHFSRTFKRFAELTPSEYRKMFRMPDYIMHNNPSGY